MNRILRPCLHRAASAPPSGKYQVGGTVLNCGPDDCLVNNGGVCPGNPNGTAGYGYCRGARSASCPCGGRVAR